MRKLAQVGTEYMILIMVVFTIFIIFYRGSFDFRIEAEEAKVEYGIKDIAFKIRDEVLLAQNSYDGYTRSFTLPIYLKGGYQYNVSITSGLLFVSSQQSIIDLPLPAMQHALVADSYNYTITRHRGIINLTN